MKRIIAIVVSVFYLLPTIGYSIDIQWCCNKISGISFSPVKAAKCNVCATPRHCCKHKHIVVKLKDTQHGSLPFKVSSNVLMIGFMPVPIELFSLKKAGLFNPQNYRPPPCYYGLPVYLANNILRV